MTRTIERWQQAILQMEESIVAFDQSVASLRDLGIHNSVEVGAGRGRVTAMQMLDKMFGLLDDLKKIECEECNHPVKAHDDQYGCQSGDHDNADGVATGPCGCRHWRREANSTPSPWGDQNQAAQRTPGSRE